MAFDNFNEIKQERKNLGFFKIFQRTDLSSEYMRAFPYKFISKLPEKDFSSQMVIRALGKRWDIEVSNNSRYYYMKPRGWDKFVTDNALGKDEFVTFIHKRKMIFDVFIYDHLCKEILVPRTVPSSGIKKEEGECSYKNVKKEEEEIDETHGRVEITARKKKVKREIGESSRGVEVKKTKVEAFDTSKKKNNTSIKVKNGVPEFTITITQTYLKSMAIPKSFVNDHLQEESEMFRVRHPNGKSWKVHCLVREVRSILSRGYSRMAREYPLSVGDKCTFKLIQPLEFLLVVSKKTREDH